MGDFSYVTSSWLDTASEDDEEFRPCPECGGCLYWDGEVWECSNCDYTEED